MDGLELANAGDHPALSLLNTRSHPWGEWIELLDTGEGFLRWCESVDLIDPAEREIVTTRFTTAQLDGVAARAREVREWVRVAVNGWADAESPKPVTAAVTKLLNGMLATDHQYFELAPSTAPVDEGVGGGLELARRRVFDHPDQLLAVVAESVAELLANGNPELVRMCEGPRCGIWFYDRTKTHKRRWCAMAVCGNRAKQRAHRDRTLQNS